MRCSASAARGWRCSPAAGAPSPGSNRSAGSSPRPAAGCSSMTAAIAGVPGVPFNGENSKNELWAGALRVLLSQLAAPPAYIGGSSSGCRRALLIALRYPADVRGLLLWRVTGGAYAAQRLIENYYTQFI